MDGTHGSTGPRRRGRLPAAERARRQRELLGAALAVIIEEGYEAATMAAIAGRAGASKETLYAWFGSREGLVTAIIEANADASAARLASVLDADDAPDLAAARETLVDYATGLLTLLTGHASVALNRAAMTSPALAAALLAAGRHRTGPLVERYLRSLDAAGLIKAPDAAEAYRRLYGLVVRDTQIRTLLGERPPSHRDIATDAERAVDAFLTLARSPPTDPSG